MPDSDVQRLTGWITVHPRPGDNASSGDRELAAQVVVGAAQPLPARGLAWTAVGAPRPVPRGGGGSAGVEYRVRAAWVRCCAGDPPGGSVLRVGDQADPVGQGAPVARECTGHPGKREAGSQGGGHFFVPACARPGSRACRVAGQLCVVAWPGSVRCIGIVFVCQVPKLRGVTGIPRRVLIEAWVHADQVAHPHRPVKGLAMWCAGHASRRMVRESARPFDSFSPFLTGGETP